MVNRPDGSPTQADPPDAALLRPLAAVGAVVALLALAFLAYVFSWTGDAITFSSRVCAKLLPVALGCIPLAMGAPFVRRTTWRARPVLRGAVAVYLALLGYAGLRLSDSNFGVVGPPPMPSADSTAPTAAPMPSAGPTAPTAAPQLRFRKRRVLV